MNTYDGREHEIRQLVALYGRVAAQYAKLFRDPELLEAEWPYLRRLYEIGPTEGTTLLDVGCGPAVYCPLATRLGLRYLGLDASIEMLGQAEVVSSTCYLILGDAGRLPIRAKTMDFAVAMGVLGHLDSGMFHMAVAEIVRVLRPGGALLIGDQLGEGRWEGPYPLDPGSTITVYARTRAEYKEVLWSCGLRIVDLGERAPGQGELNMPKILIWAVLPAVNR